MFKKAWKTLVNIAGDPVRRPYPPGDDQQNLGLGFDREDEVLYEKRLGEEIVGLVLGEQRLERDRLVDQGEGFNGGKNNKGFEGPVLGEQRLERDRLVDQGEGFNGGKNNKGFEGLVLGEQRSERDRLVDQGEGFNGGKKNKGFEGLVLGEQRSERDRLVDQGEGLNGGKNKKGYNSNISYPVKSDGEDCAYYMRNGSCKFRSSCKFNHPLKRRIPYPKATKNREGSSERPGQIECKYQMSSGGCKLGQACKYSHNKTRTPAPPTTPVNFLGLPIRPGATECSLYMHNGSCKYGSSCEFNHPEPTAAPGDNSPSGNVNGGTVSLPAVPQKVTPQWSSPSASPGATECPLYMRNGSCKHRSSCKFNHPEPTAAPGATSPSGKVIGGTVSLPAVPQKVTTQWSSPGALTGATECSLYMRNGSCKYGSSCKFNHPEPTAAPGANSPSGYVNGGTVSLPAVPQKVTPQWSSPGASPGAIECSLYMRNGSCKRGSRCKFSHPEPTAAPGANSPSGKVNGGTVSLPAVPQKVTPQWSSPRASPGATECSLYMCNGSCKYGSSCKFNHPEPTAAPEANSPSGNVNGGTVSLPAVPQKVTPQWSSPGASPGATECPLYMRNGSGKHGSSCKFNHPEPTAAPRANSPSGKVNGGTVSLPAVPQKVTPQWSSPRASPGATECLLYMRNGSCEYGSSCKFNHPEPTAAPGANSPSGKVNGGTVPQWSSPRASPGPTECSLYMHNGSCKYGSSCEFNHPEPTAAPGADSPSGNVNGGTVSLPAVPQKVTPQWSSPGASPGATECPLYMRNGSCKRGSRCKFSHPEPTAAPGANSPSGNVNGGTVSLAAAPQKVTPQWSSPGASPRATECRLYMRNGSCKRGSRCKFSHPEPTAAPGANSPSGNVKGGTVSLPAVPQKVTTQWSPPGAFPGATECSLYMHNGSCKYGSSCKFNHPEKTAAPGANSPSGNVNGGTVSLPAVPQKVTTQWSSPGAFPGATECLLYMHNGSCKYGSSCKFNHPEKTAAPGANSPSGNVNGGTVSLPAVTQKVTPQWSSQGASPGATECPLYMRNGSCKYGSSCKFNHTEPPAAPGADSPSGNVNGGTVSLPAVPQKVTPQWSSPGASPGATECSLYMCNGSCEYGSSCKFNHPEPTAAPGANSPSACKPECNYYIKTGDRKYQSSCKFHHPKNRMKSTQCTFSDKGLPLKPDEKICSHYTGYGICKYGQSCRYDHPVNYDNSSSSSGSRQNRAPFFGNSGAANGGKNDDDNAVMYQNG